MRVQIVRFYVVHDQLVYVFGAGSLTEQPLVRVFVCVRCVQRVCSVRRAVRRVRRMRCGTVHTVCTVRCVRSVRQRRGQPHGLLLQDVPQDGRCKHRGLIIGRGSTNSTGLVVCVMDCTGTRGGLALW